MYIPILSSFSTRSGERAFAVGDERKKGGEGVKDRKRKGEGTGASASRCASPLFATDTPTDRPHRSSQTLHHLYGAARQISKLRVEHRRVDCHWELAIGSSCARMPRPNDRPTTSLHINHTRSSTYKQTGRKEGRKEDTTRAVRSAPACHLRLCIFYPRRAHRELNV